jgi:hypothetical protein
MQTWVWMEKADRGPEWKRRQGKKTMKREAEKRGAKAKKEKECKNHDQDRLWILSYL